MLDKAREEEAPVGTARSSRRFKGAWEQLGYQTSGYGRQSLLEFRFTILLSRVRVPHFASSLVLD